MPRRGFEAGPASFLATTRRGFENYLIQPLVYKEAVELSGFATIAVVMAGGALLGVMGAILAVPVAASLKIVIKDLTSGRRERMTALRADAAQADA